MLGSKEGDISYRGKAITVRERVMAVVLVFEKDHQRLVCSAQWKTFGRKTVFS